MYLNVRSSARPIVGSVFIWQRNTRRSAVALSVNGVILTKWSAISRQTDLAYLISRRKFPSPNHVWRQFALFASSRHVVTSLRWPLLPPVTMVTRDIERSGRKPTLVVTSNLWAGKPADHWRLPAWYTCYHSARSDSRKLLGLIARKELGILYRFYETFSCASCCYNRALKWTTFKSLNKKRVTQLLYAESHSAYWRYYVPWWYPYFRWPIKTTHK